MLELLRKHFVITAPSIVALAGYLIIAFLVPRTDTVTLLAISAIIFGIAYFQYTRVESIHEVKLLLKFSILFRVAFLFAIPALSDDYFRFIWDGRLLANGFNPFNELPQALMNTHVASNAGLTTELFHGLNSPGYYTIYPPILQLVFGISAKLFPGDMTGSIIVMRLFILAAEAGSIWLIVRLLRFFSLPEKNIFLYALNPLVIIELTGNVHFEAFMIFFLLLSIYLLVSGKHLLSAIVFGLAVCSKLLPLLFLPFLLRYLGWKRTMMYTLAVIFTSFILFLPFINHQSINHLLSSTGLYFQKFEFNAGLFYAVRWIGYITNGYDIIQMAAPAFGIITLGLVAAVSLRKTLIDHSTLIRNMLFGLTAYFLLATIVHPWYISTLVALSVFTIFRFPIVWSGLIMMSYITYRSMPYQESMWIVAIEYAILAIAIILDFRKKKKEKFLIPDLRKKIQG